MKRQLLFMYRKYILLFTVMLLLSMGSAHGEVDAQRMVKKNFSFDFSSLGDYIPEKIMDWSQEAFEWLFGIKKKLKENLEAFIENPYKDTIAYVRIGNELCNGERLYLEKRKPKVKRALEVLLDCPLEDHEVPTIAFVASGGGYRAVIALLGSLIGAQKDGFLDAGTYITGVSGSSWMIGTWMSSGLPLVDFKESLVEKLCKGLTHVGPKGSLLMADMLLVKYASDQSITLVDFYGALLGHALFRDQKEKRHRMYLSGHVDRIKNGDWLFPIYSAVRGDNDMTMDWYEFTPFEVGAHWLNAYVPTWAYARQFENGVSIDYDPEQSLGYHFGVFGSAFSASFSRIYSEFKNNISFDITKNIIEKILEKVGNKRLSTAKVHNFTYGMKNSPIKTQKELRLIDAGIAVNIGYQPVSGQRPERKADVMIILDSSGEVIDADNLRRAEQYAHAHNLPFPYIDYEGIDTKVVSVFADDNPEVPIVVYMPLINDFDLWERHKNDPEFAGFDQYLKDFDPIVCMAGSYCSTFDFTYEEFQLRQLSALTEFNMRMSAQAIYDAIELAVERRAS